MVLTVGVKPTIRWLSTNEVCLCSRHVSVWWRRHESNLRCSPVGCVVYSHVLSPLSHFSVFGQRGRSRTGKNEGLSFACLPLHHSLMMAEAEGIEPTTLSRAAVFKTV